MRDRGIEQSRYCTGCLRTRDFVPQGDVWTCLTCGKDLERAYVPRQPERAEESGDDDLTVSA